MSLSRVHGLPYELMLRIVGFFDLKDLRVFLMTSKHSYQQKLQLMAIVFSSSWSVHRLVASNRVPMLTKMKVLGMTRCDGGKGLLMIRTFDDASHVLMWSACHGFVDTIERVAPYCRREDLNIALALACANGVASAVRTLLETPGVEPGAMDNYAILLACENGQAGVLRLLLSDPRIDRSRIRYHRCMRNSDILELLLDFQVPCIG